MIPNLIYFTDPSCAIIDASYNFLTRILSLVFYSTTPLIILLVFSILTWSNLRHTPPQIIRLNRIEHQVTIIMLAQIVIVLLASGPNIFLQLYIVITHATKKNEVYFAYENFVFTLIAMLGFITHSGSFYSYITFSKNYRRKVKIVFHR